MRFRAILYKNICIQKPIKTQINHTEHVEAAYEHGMREQLQIQSLSNFFFVFF